MTNDELKGLTPEENRIRIAELCGWTLDKRSGDLIDELVPAWRPPPNNFWAMANVRSIVADLLPDYLGSLDCMHDAEKLLTDDQRPTYYRHLNHFWSVWSAVHATASQRADAFLLTMNPPTNL